MVLIEVQTGIYLDEDDIIRFEEGGSASIAGRDWVCATGGHCPDLQSKAHHCLAPHHRPAQSNCGITLADVFWPTNVRIKLLPDLPASALTPVSINLGGYRNQLLADPLTRTYDATGDRKRAG
jgi:hypothetical protein